MDRLVEVFADASALFGSLAADVASRASVAVDSSGRFVLALGGGSAVVPLLQALGRQPLLGNFPWQRAHVFWCDETCGGQGPQGSHYERAWRELAGTAMGRAELHRVPVGGTAADAAAAYSRVLAAEVGSAGIDVVVLAQGSGAGAVPPLALLDTAAGRDDRGFAAARASDAGCTVAMTSGELTHARAVVLVILGSEQATTLAGLRSGEAQAGSRWLRSHAGASVCTDAATAAASRLEPDEGETAARPTDAAKRNAGWAAGRLVAPDMVVGLGTGSTAYWFVRELGRRLHDGEVAGVVGVPTSLATEDVARAAGVPTVGLADRPRVDLAVDGADEVSPRLDLIKGRGGALVREKIVARSADRLVVVVDPSKLTPRLGVKSAVPVAVVPFGWAWHLARLRDLGAEPELRRAADGAPFLTDDGLMLIDARFKDGLHDPSSIHAEVERLPGVAGSGLFLGMTRHVLVGDRLGCWAYRR